MLAFNHVIPNWHRKMPKWKVKSILRSLHKIILSDETNLKFKRVYIKKPSGKYRPLGCPTIAWRIYLHMLNQLLVLYAYQRKIISTCQHGFLPRRGTLTAWRDILSRVIKSPDIYEIDIKGFFDNVDHGSLRNSLRNDLNLPKDWLDRIMLINRSLVELPSKEEQLVEEPDAKIRYNADSTISKQYLNVPGPHPHSDIPIPDDLMITMMKEDMEDLDGVPISWIKNNYETVYRKYQELQWATLESLGVSHDDVDKESVSSHRWMFESPEQNWYKQVGVPQGAATSPFISILSLGKFTRSMNGEVLERTKSYIKSKSYRCCLGYADDWIIYGQRMQVSDIDDALLHSSGTRLNPSKSGWVRKDGLWVKPLKFLGLSYNGLTDKLYASTHNGANLEFSKHNLIHALSIASSPRIHHYLYTGQSGGSMTKDKIYANSPLDDLTVCDSEGNIETIHPGDSSYEKWESLSKAEALGLLQSRLYINDWNASDVSQNFKLTSVAKSYVAGVRRKLKLNIFNCSSYAMDWLINWQSWKIQGNIRKQRRYIKEIHSRTIIE